MTDTLKDPLVECLVYITRLDKRQVSAQSVVAGLPLVNNRLTPEVFLRTAERYGYTASIVERKPGEISDQVLPCILLLRNLQACVLLSFPSADSARIMHPDEGEKEISLHDLEKSCSGFAILIKSVQPYRTEPDIESNPLSKHWFRDTMKKSWKLYAEVIVASLLINLFALANPLFVMNVYDRVVPNNAIETLWVLAIGIGIVLTFDFVLKILRGYFIDSAGKRADIILSSQIFEHVMGMQLSRRPGAVGSFANNLHEFETFREFFTSSTLATLIDLPFIIIFLLVIWAIGGPVVWIPVCAIPLVVITGLLLQIPLKKLIDQMFVAGSRKHAALIESLAGLEAIKSLGAEGFLQRQWEYEVGTIARLGQKSRLLTSSAINISTFIQQLSYVGVIVYGVYIIAAGELTIGGLIACTILTGRALMPMSQVASLMTRYQQSRAAYKSLDNIMRLPLERPQDRKFLYHPVVKGDIEFRDVKFTYPQQKIPALNGISFRIAAGERVAFIGRIGSGKSTIQKLILGLYQPDSGTILIDGIDIRQIDPVDLRRNIGYVPQEILLFRGSVRDNITFGAPPVEEEAIFWAAEISGIAEHLKRHPDGYDMSVGEKGAGLSGGQRQTIAIARALLLDPPLLLLDEPTNALDNTTEENFKKQLTLHLQGKTLILVTHKATPLSLIDRLIVIDNGRIAIDGPRDKVIEALAGGKVRVAQN